MSPKKRTNSKKGLIFVLLTGVVGFLYAILQGVIGNYVFEYVKASWESVSSYINLLSNYISTNSTAILLGFAIAGVVLGIIFISKKRFNNKRRAFEQIPGLRRYVGHHFVDRTKEIQDFVSILEGNLKTKIINVYGSPGVGKSWLVDKYIDEIKVAKSIWAKIDFRQTKYEPLLILDSIARQLDEQLFGNLLDDLQSVWDFYENIQDQTFVDRDTRLAIDLRTRELTDEFLKLLLRLTQKKKIVLFFDTFELAEKRELGKWVLAFLLPVLTDPLRGKNIITIFSGWNKLDFMNIQPDLVLYQELKNFNEGDVYEVLLASSNLPVSKIDNKLANSVHQKTDGHPLAVGLTIDYLRETKADQVVSSIEHQLDTQHLETSLITEVLVHRTLEKIEAFTRTAIRYAAITRWFDSDILRLISEDGLDYSLALDQIRNLSFVRAHAPLGFEYHQIVRDLLLRQWVIEDRPKFLELQKRALEYFNNRYQQEPDSTLKEGLEIEILYHQSFVDKNGALQRLEMLFESAIALYRTSFCEKLLEVSVGLRSEVSTRSSYAFFEAQLAFNKGNWDTVSQLCEELLATENLSTQIQSSTQNLLGNLYYRRGNIIGACNLFENSIELDKQTNHKRGIAKTLSDLADAYKFLGDYDKSLDYLHQSLDILESFDDKDQAAWTWLNIGNIYRAQTERAPALSAYENAIRLFEKAEDKHGIGRVLYNFGRIYSFQGKWIEAEKVLHDGIKILRDLNSDYSLAMAIRFLGNLRRLEDRRNDANKYYLESLEIYKKLDNKIEIANALANIGLLRLADGDFDSANKHFNEAYLLHKNAKNDRAMALVLIYQGELAIEKSEFIAAENIFLNALTIMEEQKVWFHHSLLLMRLAQIHLKKGTDIKEISKLLSLAQKIATKESFYDILCEIHYTKAELILSEFNQHLTPTVSNKLAKKLSVSLTDVLTQALFHNCFTLDKYFQKSLQILSKLDTLGYSEQTSMILNQIRHEWLSNRDNGIPLYQIENTKRAEELKYSLCSSVPILSEIQKAIGNVDGN